MVTQLLNRKKINPAILTFTGTQHVDEISIQLFNYNKTDCIENAAYAPIQLKDLHQNGFNNWLNIYGIHDPKKIKEICEELQIHNLTIQDILDVNQRPKFQEYENYWFFTLKSMIPTETDSIEQEQLSFILGKDYLVSFQERKADYFNHIRERMRKSIGLVRERGSDFLLFLLLESILDNYCKTIEELEDQIEELIVMDIHEDPSPEIINSIERFKRQVLLIKRSVTPIREFVTRLEREKFNFVDALNVKYFFELKDLSLSLSDSCEQIEAQLESSTNLFFSIQGHRMNQVMKTLTIVATIFIPLTFIAGIYGMNFSHMPELSWRYGYMGVWLVMLMMLLLMVLYFKRKRWF